MYFDQTVPELVNALVEMLAKTVDCHAFYGCHPDGGTCPECESARNVARQHARRMIAEAAQPPNQSPSQL